jgi:glyoxylase-like metal-dependent hydrolase (beta-lactamase superfamily II)
MVLAPNPGVMTGPGTNTYVVGTGPTFVIDPAVDDAEYVKEVLRVAGDVDQILITHRHEDHVGGAQALARMTGARVRAFGAERAGEAEVVPLDDGETLRVGGATLTAMHTPGHASDHLSYYFEGAASLFSGDNILGEGTSVIAPPDGNMRNFMASLERVSQLHLDRIFPGHFRPLDGGRQIIDELLAHRRAREAAIVASITTGGLTVEEIVERVYEDTPSHLHPIALFSVLAHLEKLEEEGAARNQNGRWSAHGAG